MTVGLFGATGDAAAATTTCEKYALVPVAGGAYSVQTNEWNSDARQCVSTDGTASFSVTESAISVGTSGPPGSYPSIYRGCHWGACTSNSGLPVQVSNLGHPTSSWSTTQPNAGTYDVAYDIWFNQSPSTTGQPNGAELMVWLNHKGPVQPAGSKVATVTVAGHTWDVWRAQMSGWNSVAYVRTTGVTNVSNLDLGDITRDAVSRGVISPSWYLIGVEAGFELWQGGAGLATTSFSFQPNGSTTTTTTSPSTTSTTNPPTTTTTKPVSSGATCSATYRVTAQWVNGAPPNGYTADVIVRNSGTSTINTWRVAWTWPNSGQRVTSAWNANLVQSGSMVTAANMSYNGIIDPGGTQSFGFQGVWTSSNPVPIVTCST